MRKLLTGATLIAGIAAVALLLSWRMSLGPSLAEAQGDSVAPLFLVTIDETHPANPDIPPFDDDCPVGIPCKVRTEVGIGPYHPLMTVATITPNTFFVAHDTDVPNGMRVGTASATAHYVLDPLLSCESNAVPMGVEVVLLDAAIDPASTTGSPDDLASPFHWPSQLDDERDAIQSLMPGHLWARYVGIAPASDFPLPLNIFVFRLDDGSFLSLPLVGDPSFLAADGDTLSVPGIKLCTPITAQVTIQGIATDGVVILESIWPPPPPPLLRACRAPGIHTFVGIFDPLNTPPGDSIFVTDTVTCSEGPPPPPDDSDGDGVPNHVDNCPFVPNPGQEDIDEDGIGDVCDLDIDGDTLDNGADNCPFIPNPDQVDNDADGHGDVCDPDDDNDGFPDEMELALGSDPFDPASTPEHFTLPESCADGEDNDLDGLIDADDPGCQVGDADGDGFPDEMELALGSDPHDPASTPEHAAMLPSCFDEVDNDLDGLIDADDPGCQVGDTDGDGFPDEMELALGSDPHDPASTPEHFTLPERCADGEDNDLDGLVDVDDPGCTMIDSDGDGFPDLVELHLGSDPLDSASTPEHAVMLPSCFDEVDNDLDGLVDADDPGCLPPDSDNDGFPDPVELALESDPHDPASTPEHVVVPSSCFDEADNDLDGLVDSADPGCFLFDIDGDHDPNATDADDDGDGFPDEVEGFVGTDPLDGCPDDPSDDAWPLDIDMDREISFSLDVMHYAGNVGCIVADDPACQRLDLNADGDISFSSDVMQYAAKIGDSCT